MLKPLELHPGVFSDVTPYAMRNMWVRSTGVRFFEATPERIGGNEIYQPAAVVDSDIHALFVWATYGSQVLTAYGCETAYYVCDGTNMYDTTPFEHTYTPTAVTTTAGFAAILIAVDTSNVPDADTWITISGVTSAVGGIPASDINGIRQVVTVSGGYLTVAVAVPATSAFSGAVSGLTVSIRASFVTTLSGSNLGFGLGAFGGVAGLSSGRFGFGGANVTSTDSRLFLWSQDTFGEWLVYCPRGGSIYVWDPNEPSTRAKSLAELGAVDYPIDVSYILMSDRSRQLVALGTNETDSAVFDPMLVRWSDVEDLTSWTPQVTNLAGSVRLTEGSAILCGVRTQQDLLIFTDTALYALSDIWQPGPVGFNLRLLATKVALISPNAIVADDDSVYWMARDGFYRYDGRVTRIKCSIARWVQNNVRTDLLRMTTVAGSNKAFDEIWFSFPGKDATQPSLCAVFNTQSGAWYPMLWGRSAWNSGVLLGAPISASGQVCVKQEQGDFDWISGTAQPIEAYIESGAIELVTDSGAGEVFAFLSKIIPDVRFEDGAGTVTMTVKAYHDAGALMGVASTPTGQVVADIDSFTPQLDVRIRGRHLTLRLDGGTKFWRLGVPRLSLRPDGRK